MDNFNKRKSVTELEEVLVEAIRRLDIEMFKEFCVHVEEFNENKDSRFVNGLRKAFEKFRGYGDTQLESNLGYCKGCNKDCYGYLFVGNKSKNFINIVFEKDRQKIKGMVECTKFEVLNKNEELNERIHFTSFYDPDSNDFDLRI